MSENGESLFQESDYTRFRRDFNTLIERCLVRSSKIIILSTLHMFKWRKYNPVIEIIRRKLMIKPKEYLNDGESVVIERKNIINYEGCCYREMCQILRYRSCFDVVQILTC